MPRHEPLPDTAKPSVFRTSLIILAGIAAALQVGKVPVAMPGLQQSFGIGLGAMGAFMAIFSICGAVGGVPAGMLIARWGDRRLLLAGLLVLAGAAATGAAAGTYALLIASRIAEGFGFLLISVAAPALLQRLVEPARRKPVLAVWSCFMPAGIALAMVLFPLIDQWRAVWAINAIIAMILLIGNALILPRTPAGAGASARSPGQAMRIFTLPRPMLLALIFAAYNIMFYALVSFLPALLTARIGIGAAAAGGYGALLPLANIAGNLAAGWIAARPGRMANAVLPFAFLVMGLTGPVIFLGWLPPVATLGLSAMFGAAGGLIPATLFALMPDATGAPERAPLGFGLLLQGSNLGLILGPAIVGWFAQHMGWPGAAIVVVIAAILGLVLVTFRSSPRVERPTRA